MNVILAMQIEDIRKKMILVGGSRGLSSPETLSLSETLDQLINLYMSKSEKESIKR